MIEPAEVPCPEPRVPLLAAGRRCFPCRTTSRISSSLSSSKYVFMDDEHAMTFLGERFQPKVLKRFKELRRGSHKVRL